MMMRGQSYTKGKEETVASKWADLMEYEKHIDGDIKSEQERETVTPIEKFQKIKKNTSKKFRC